MERVSVEYYDELVSYMQKDLANCIYMYIDIVTYGLDSDAIKVWVEKGEKGIALIAMEYFGSIQLYSLNHDYDFEGLQRFLIEEDPPRVNGDREIIDRLWPHYDHDKYKTEYGTIMKIDNYVIRQDNVDIKTATLEDVEGIAELIMDEPELNVGFSKEELMDQTAERIEKGYGESFIIKEGEEIVAHNCINAECNEFLVGALTVVRPDRRNTLYGSILDAHISTVAKERGKDFYVFLKDPRRIKMFKAMKNIVVGEYGRIKKINQD